LIELIEFIGLIAFIGFIELIEFIGLIEFLSSAFKIFLLLALPFPNPQSVHPTFSLRSILFSRYALCPLRFALPFPNPQSVHSHFPLPIIAPSHLLIFPPSFFSAICPLSSGNECRRQKNFTLIRNRSHDMSPFSNPSNPSALNLLSMPA
jgi:hypothetical protein